MSKRTLIASTVMGAFALTGSAVSADTLDELHKEGFIHRDLSPEIILINRHGYLTVLRTDLKKRSNGTNIGNG